MLEIRTQRRSIQCQECDSWIEYVKAEHTISPFVLFSQNVCVTLNITLASMVRSYIPRATEKTMTDKSNN